MKITGWEGIRAEAMRRIRSGEWQAGAGIPGEVDLATEFGVARATVNRALRELAAAGVLERRRKAGSRVALNPVRKASFDIPVTRLEVEGRGQAYSFDLLEEAVALAPADVARRLGLRGKLLHLRTLHRADGMPFAYEDRWLNPAVLPDAVRDFRVVSANEWLVRHMPYTEGDIAFSACSAAPEEAGWLRVAPGAALFVAERTTWAGAVAITLVRLAYAPGYRVQSTV